MSRVFDTYGAHSMILFPFPEGLSPNAANFLGHTPTASEGVLSCDLLATQLYGVLHTSYPNEVPLFSVVIFQLGRSRLLEQAVQSRLGVVNTSSL